MVVRGNFWRAQWFRLKLGLELGWPVEQFKLNTVLQLAASYPQLRKTKFALKSNSGIGGTVKNISYYFLGENNLFDFRILTQITNETFKFRY